MHHDDYNADAPECSPMSAIHDREEETDRSLIGIEPRELSRLQEERDALRAELAKAAPSATAWNLLMSSFDAIDDAGVSRDVQGDAALNAYIDAWKRMRAERDAITTERDRLFNARQDDLAAERRLVKERDEARAELADLRMRATNDATIITAATTDWAEKLDAIGSGVKAIAAERDELTAEVSRLATANGKLVAQYTALSNAIWMADDGEPSTDEAVLEARRMNESHMLNGVLQAKLDLAREDIGQSFAKGIAIGAGAGFVMTLILFAIASL